MNKDLIQNPIIAVFLLFSSTVFSQNQAPSISITGATVDWSQQVMNISYAVSDPESDPLEITFKVSDDEGKSFLHSTSVITGDVGYPVTSGSNKNLVWDYNDSIKDFSDFVFILEANDRQSINIQDIVDQVDSSRIYANVSFMEGLRNRTTGPVNLQNTRDSIYQRFDRYEMLPWIQNFSYGAYTGQNIIGHLAGMKSEDTVYIIDAHYDGVAGGPAADDNASGTAGVLEAARILSQYSFEKSIRFIGFDLEEEGLKGSIAYVSSGVVSGESIDGVLNFEMIGYYSDKDNSQVVPSGFNVLFPSAYAQLQADNFRGNFISTTGNANSNSLNASFKSNAQLYVPQLKVIDLSVPGNGTIAPDFRRSDHAPFWDTNRKALMISDGANFRNNNYHTANDVKDSLDFGFMTNVVKATVATAASLAIPRHSAVEVFVVSNPLGLNAYNLGCNVSVNYSKISNAIHLSFADCEQEYLNYALITESGKILKEGRTAAAKRELKIEPVVELARGVYFLQLVNENGQSMTTKLLVE